MNTNLHTVGENCAFYTPQDNLDTVVFVHGLRGHFCSTWANFPRLLSTDIDLPKLDILLWGYPTGVIKPLVSSTKDIGGDLISDLVTRIQNDNSIHMVGHSMGGLVILEGLIAELIGQRAEREPTRQVSFISLFASPVSGSTAAALVWQTGGKLWLLRPFINKHIRSLARGKGVDDLLTQVMRRIEAPQQEDSSSRHIPLRMVMARRDKAVSETASESSIS